jgi:xanthine dehydrogenase molybdenum-binding subunit
MNIPVEYKPREFRVLGTRPVRPDGLEKVTGAAKFGDDFHLPGMLHGKTLRSSVPHARIRSIDASAAFNLPGVRAVVTGADFPPLNQAVVAGSEGGFVNMQDIADNCIAKDKVFYDGHVIAAVAADNPHVAEEACKLIKVDLEELPFLMDVRDAVKDGAPVLHEDFIPGAFLFPTQKALPNAGRLQLAVGDLEQGFKESDVVIEREYRTATVHQGYIELHVTTCKWDTDGKLTVWTSTQGAFAIRDFLAATLNLPLSKIKVIPLEIGGGFGGKDVVYLDPVAAMLSKKTGRPVKMAMNRAEVLKATGPSPATYTRIKMGCKKDGTLVAADLYMLYEGGAYPGGPIAPGVLTALTRYNIPNVMIDGYDVLLNKPKIKPYRAPGATQSHFVTETMMDELAEAVGMDPVDFRLKNASKTGDRLIIGVPIPPIGSIEMLEAVKNHPHYKAPLGGPNRGRGVAYAFWFGAGLTSSCAVHVNVDGTVNLTTGSADLSGTRMTLAMQAAEILGIPVEKINCTVADTDEVGYTFQSVGSRTTFATGFAVVKASEEIMRIMAARAAVIWDTDPANVEAGFGEFTHKGDPSKKLTFQEIAAKAEETGGLIIAQASANPHGVGPQLAANIVDVEVDPETGKVDILRFTAFQDVGKAVHPDYVEGQMQGGVVQGLGWALNEEYWYNAKGQLANASLLDYRMPTSLDVPMIECVIHETPNPGHPFGVRGAGEVPIVPPPAAVANAIYRAAGVRLYDLPMKPGTLLEALWAKQAQPAKAGKVA